MRGKRRGLGEEEREGKLEIGEKRRRRGEIGD